MIVSHKNRFIFIKTRKTAGTSIEIALAKFCGPDDIITRLSASEEQNKFDLGYRGSQNTRIPLNQYRKWDLWFWLRGGGPAHHFNHTSASLIKRRMDPESFREYCKFCVVRNPWDRAVSIYYWRKYRAKEALPENVNFTEFLSSSPTEVLTNSGLYLVDGEPAIDRFIKFENLEMELAEILEEMGLEMVELPHAKGNTRKTKEHYSIMFDNDSIDLIARICNWEIEYFGYEFEDLR